MERIFRLDSVQRTSSIMDGTDKYSLTYTLINRDVNIEVVFQCATNITILQQGTYEEIAESLHANK